MDTKNKKRSHIYATPEECPLASACPWHVESLACFLHYRPSQLLTARRPTKLALTLSTFYASFLSIYPTSISIVLSWHFPKIPNLSWTSISHLKQQRFLILLTSELSLASQREAENHLPVEVGFWKIPRLSWSMISHWNEDQTLWKSSSSSEEKEVCKIKILWMQWR